MSEKPPREYISAREAAVRLRVTERQVNYYGHNGQLRTQRIGRRVAYHAGDVARLAEQLQVDIRPQQITRQDANEHIIRYVQERGQLDQEFLEAQRQIAGRLARIEEQLTRPASGPSWQLIATLAIVLALALVVLAILIRLF